MLRNSYFCVIISYDRRDDTRATQPLYGGDKEQGHQARNARAPVYLFSRGLRYRVNNRKLPGSPDIVLKKYKTVVFIDGCFWHGHEGCKYYRLPKTNADFWRHKIILNIARDYANNVDLELAGWRVIRIWECDVRTKAKREATLTRLYDAIVGNNTYHAIPDLLAMVAEPMRGYGEKQ